MIIVRIPNDVAPGLLDRVGNVVKVVSAMQEVGSLLAGSSATGLVRVDYAIVHMANGVVLRVRFDDCELLAY